MTLFLTGRIYLVDGLRYRTRSTGGKRHKAAQDAHLVYSGNRAPHPVGNIIPHWMGGVIAGVLCACPVLISGASCWGESLPFRVLTINSTRRDCYGDMPVKVPDCVFTSSPFHGDYSPYHLCRVAGLLDVQSYTAPPSGVSGCRGAHRPLAGCLAAASRCCIRSLPVGFSCWHFCSSAQVTV